MKCKFFFLIFPFPAFEIFTQATRIRRHRPLKTASKTSPTEALRYQ